VGHTTVAVLLKHLTTESAFSLELIARPLSILKLEIIIEVIVNEYH